LHLRVKLEIFFILFILLSSVISATVHITPDTLTTSSDLRFDFTNDWARVTNASFDFVDKVEIAEPATPPADTLRLYAEDFHGFSLYKYLDSTGMKRQLLRDSIIVVKNVRGSTIAASRIVYATGSENDVPTIDLANASSLSTMPAIGVTIASIANNTYGRVMQIGLLENINTLAYSVGDVLYVSDSTPGVPTSTIPVTPSLIQEIGTVLVDSATVGAIQIVARALDGNEFGTINDFIVQKNLTAVGPLILQGVTSDPPGLVDGMIWYNTTTGLFYCRANGATYTLNMTAV